jgi:tellurite resistance protein
LRAPAARPQGLRGLPTAAGGLIAGDAAAELGFTTLSHVLFGLGITTFIVLGSIITIPAF